MIVKLFGEKAEKFKQLTDLCILQNTKPQIKSSLTKHIEGILVVELEIE